jgi:hypothetical protein
VLLGLPERRAERAPVLERMRHVTQIGLGRVMHESGEGILRVTAALLDQAGDDHGMLSDRVEDSAVPAEPALVGERSGDVAGVQLFGIRIEWVHPTARDRLKVRPRYEARPVIGGHVNHRRRGIRGSARREARGSRA